MAFCSDCPRLPEPPSVSVHPEKQALQGTGAGGQRGAPWRGRHCPRGRVCSKLLVVGLRPQAQLEGVKPTRDFCSSKAAQGQVEPAMSSS